MAIAADTWVETIRGRLRAYEITPDMYVFGMDGYPVKIKSVQTYMPQKMYYVEFSDGSNLEGDQFLTFPIRTRMQRLGTTRHKKPPSIYHKRKYHYRSVEELLEHGLKNKRSPNRTEFSVDTVAPLQYGYEDHAVPPFVAGMWFARTNGKGRYKFPDELKQYAKANIQKSRQFMVVEKEDYWEVRPSIEAMFLRDYAQIPVKEFPYKYLYGTPEQRIEFLQGYFAIKFNTFCKRRHRFYLRTRRKVYELQMIQLLCESLGIKTTLAKQTTFWALQFKTRFPFLPNQLPPKQKFGERHRLIVKLEPCATKLCVHLETDKPIAVGDSFIPICQ